MAKEEKIYILKLQRGNYYVGRAVNVIHRLDEHRSKGVRAAAWTKEYEIIDIAEVRPLMSDNDEDNIVEEYMDKYGIDHVRGGVYSTIHLSAETKHLLQTKIWHKNGLCIRCGRPDHMIKNCKQLEDIFGNRIDEDDKEVIKEEKDVKKVFSCPHCSKEYKTKSGFDKHVTTCEVKDVKSEAPKAEKKKYVCEKCGREGHVAGTWWCAVGTPKEKEITCSKCQEQGHYAVGCRK